MGNGEGESNEEGYEDRVVSVSESKRSEEERENGLGVRPRLLKTELASSRTSCGSAIVTVAVGGKSKDDIAFVAEGGRVDEVGPFCRVNCRATVKKILVHGALCEVKESSAHRQQGAY